MLNNKNILIVNDNHFIRNNDTYEFKGSKFHLFLKSFSQINVTLSSPSTDDGVLKNSEIIIDGVKVKPRLGYGSALNFYKTLPFRLLKYYRGLKKHIVQADAVLLVAPSCSLPISYFLCRKLNKPLALYIVGDVVEVIRQDKVSSHWLKLFKLFFAKWEWIVTAYIVKKHPSFSLGSSLVKKLSKSAFSMQPAMTSLVYEQSIVEPSDKPLERPVKLLTVCRLSNEKGVHVALDVLSMLSESVEVTYQIIGDGPEKAHLEALVDEMGLSKVVSFSGYLGQAEIREAYLDSDIFLLPSLSEGIPKVILDAMAYAVPVISTRVGGVADLVSSNEERGWLVTPNSDVELYLAMLECINNDTLRHNKLLAATKFIQQHTSEKEASRIEAILLRLCGD